MAKKKPAVKPTKAKTPEDSFAPIAKELTLAHARINGVPAGRLKWLLAFSELPLDSLSEGRLADLRWELVVFGLNRKPDEMKREFDIFFDLCVLTLLLPTGEPIPLSEIEKVLPKVAIEEQNKEAMEADERNGKKGAPLWLLKEFQETMRYAFDNLFKPGWWEVKRPTAVERIALDIKSEQGAAQNPPAFTGHDLLLMQAIDLIKAERQRLRTCQNPKCRKRFVAAKRGRAFFHSPQCSAYVRVNKA